MRVRQNPRYRCSGGRKAAGGADGAEDGYAPAAAAKTLTSDSVKRKTRCCSLYFTSAMGRRGDLLEQHADDGAGNHGAAIVADENKSEHGMPAISKEQVVRINPDIFMLPTWNYNQ